MCVVDITPESVRLSLNREQSGSTLPYHYSCHRPRRESARGSFCGKQSVLIELHHSGVIAWRQRRRSCLVCLKLNFCGTLSFPTKMANSTHMIYIRTWTGRYVFKWDRLLHEGLAFFKREFPRVLMTCANFKCEVADVNNGIPINFRAVKYVPVESGQPCRDNISWYIQLD